jgi:hypothetical protein
MYRRLGIRAYSVLALSRHSGSWKRFEWHLRTEPNPKPGARRSRRGLSADDVARVAECEFKAPNELEEQKGDRA